MRYIFKIYFKHIGLEVKYKGTIEVPNHHFRNRSQTCYRTQFLTAFDYRENKTIKLIPDGVFEIATNTEWSLFHK